MKKIWRKSSGLSIAKRKIKRKSTGLSSYELFTNFIMRRMPEASWVSLHIIIIYDYVECQWHPEKSPHIMIIYVYQNIELTRIIRDSQLWIDNTPASPALTPLFPYTSFFIKQTKAKPTKSFAMGRRGLTDKMSVANLVSGQAWGSSAQAPP